MAKIMKRPHTDIQRRVLHHVSRGKTDCARAQQGVRQIENTAATVGVASGWRDPSTVNAKRVRKSCEATADAATRKMAAGHSHMLECYEINSTIRRIHGSATLPRRTLCGDHLGQMMHQQIRAAATRLNACTGKHQQMCTNTRCTRTKETNKHAVVECHRYANARQRFNQETGIRITSENYIDIMALDAKKLGVAVDVLAKALCKLLAYIATTHSRVRNFASVAFPLDGGSNKRRSIIQAHEELRRLEREPD